MQKINREATGKRQSVLLLIEPLLAGSLKSIVGSYCTKHCFTEFCTGTTHPTFDRGVGRWSLNAQVPWWISLVGKVPHLQVADGEPDDGGLVQLAGDGAWQRQHLGQFIKFKVLLSPPRSRRVP